MLKEILNKIEELQQEIGRFGEFPLDVKNKIYYKLRLDWNYYSNSIEGGTLTREETRSVMSGVLNLKNKPNKDFREMDGHNKVVLDLFKLAKGEMRISESRIKEMHAQIMYDDSEDAKTLIGQWKPYDNEVISYKGEKIKFKKFTEVPDLMHDLLNKLNAYLDHYLKNPAKVEKHPVEIAANFHIDFLTIHPFYDGNGRMARILSNLILIACGYPIFIITKDDKDAYNQLLSDIQAYGGDRNQFIEFIGERIVSTQNIILNALRGGDIEDDDDLDKEIELLKRRQIKTPDPIKKSKESMRHVLNKVYKPILIEVNKLGGKFSQLFEEVEWVFYHDPFSIKGFVRGDLSKMISEVSRSNKESEGLISEVKLNLYLLNYNDDNNFSAELAIRINFYEEYFNIEVLTGIPMESGVVFTLIKELIEASTKDELKISDGETYQLTEGSYDMELTASEIKEYGKKIGRVLLNFIKQKTEKK